MGLNQKKISQKLRHQIYRITISFAQDFLVKHFQKLVKGLDLMTKLKEHCFSTYAEYWNIINQNMLYLKMFVTSPVMITETPGELFMIN